MEGSNDRCKCEIGADLVTLVKCQALEISGMPGICELAVALLIKSLRSRQRPTDADCITGSFKKRYGRDPKQLILPFC